MKRSFNFYGVRVLVEATTPRLFAVLDDLNEDFYFFSSPEQFEEPAITIRLSEETAAAPKRVALFKTRMCRAYGARLPRECFYGQGTSARLEWDQGGKKVLVQSPEPTRAYEVAYVALLSLVGEELDLLGYHRIHALGLASGLRAGAIVLPPGGGKSAVAILLGDDSRVRLFSDEQPLLRGGKIYPFPIRMGLRPSVADALVPARPGRLFSRMAFPSKRLFKIDREKVAVPSELTFVALGSFGPEPKKILAGFCSQLRLRLEFVGSMVLGHGTQQMSEFMLSVDSFPRLVRIALSRLREAVRISFSCEFKGLQVSSNAFENAKFLGEVISASKTAHFEPTRSLRNGNRLLGP